MYMTLICTKRWRGLVARNYQHPAHGEARTLSVPCGEGRTIISVAIMKEASAYLREAKRKVKAVSKPTTRAERRRFNCRKQSKVG